MEEMIQEEVEMFKVRLDHSFFVIEMLTINQNFIGTSINHKEH